MSASVVYVTAADREQALDIGRRLVEERLAACANVLEPMTAVYWWEGRVQQAHEAVLIAKTRTELVDRVVARVRELHSYTCPCVVAWPITGGNADFLKWIRDATE
jgi:periplasmic divalent cation tolerance protein